MIKLLLQIPHFSHILHVFISVSTASIQNRRFSRTGPTVRPAVRMLTVRDKLKGVEENTR